MIMNRTTVGGEWRVARDGKPARVRAVFSRHLSPVTRHIPGFTLVEVMVVMVLLSLIVLALMAVFDSTQTAFRAGVTQTDVLESGRATMDLMAADVRIMAPSYGRFNTTNGAVNFCAYVNDVSVPLVQPLTASSQKRTNVLERIFVLSRNNVNGQDTWTGTGYVVDTGSTTSINPLYRFSASTNAGAADPSVLFNDFLQPRPSPA